MTEPLLVHPALYRCSLSRLTGSVTSASLYRHPGMDQARKVSCLCLAFALLYLNTSFRELGNQPTETDSDTQE